DTGSRVVVQALFVWNFRFRREGSTIRTPDLYLFRRSRGKRDVLLRLAVLAGVRSVKRPRSLILILGIKRDRAIYGLVENLVRILSIWIIPVRALELKRCYLPRGVDGNFGNRNGQRYKRMIRVSPICKRKRTLLCRIENNVALAVLSRGD